MTFSLSDDVSRLRGDPTGLRKWFENENCHFPTRFSRSDKTEQIEVDVREYFEIGDGSALV
jgi:hypothetical protein